jgi:maleate isomerase
MITPSQNTTLEPVNCELVRNCPEVSVHFTRIAVSGVSLDQRSAKQFTFANFLSAARLLVDARVQAIAWNGTSGSWMGVDLDRRLCRQLEDAVGVPVTSSTLALIEAFRQFGVERYSLAVPYSKDMADRIVEVYAAEGFQCVHSTFRGWNTGPEQSAMDEPAVRDLLDSAAHPKSQGIAVVCTNVRAAPLVEEVERNHNTTVFDSVLMTTWQCLRMVGFRNPGFVGWGRLLHAGDPPA